jgi:hypothetical protein
MIKDICLYIFGLFILLLFATSCSNGNSLLVPGDNEFTASDNARILIGEYSPEGKVSTGFGALGIFQVSINTNSLQGEMIPLRQVSATDSLESVDITNFLTLSPCIDCVKLASIGFDRRSRLLLTIGIKHPFDAADASQPISGINRADLHLFNIEGTVIINSGNTFEFPRTGEIIDTVRLINADGYSKYMDESLDAIYPTDATIHPYIMHFDDYTQGNFNASNTSGFLSITTPLPEGNLVMPMGSGFDFKDYIFSVPPGENFSFVFAVGCSFGASAENFNQRLTAIYRVPQFNKKAASEIGVSVTDWGYIAGDTGSTVDCDITVLDISHGVEVGTAINQMTEASSVKEIRVEVPGMMTDPMILTDPTASGGNGRNPHDPLTFPVTLTNTAGGTDSFYPALVKVTDSFQPNTTTTGIYGGSEGLKRFYPGDTATSALYEIDEFATYYAFVLAEPGAGPVCSIITDPSPASVDQAELIEFDGSGSTDDGLIEFYEWDLDYDGSNFDVDTEGAVITPNLCTAGTFDVALRLTDNDLNESICSVEVTITADTEPIDGWGTDLKINLGTSPIEPLISNTSNRAIVAYENYLFVVMNSNQPVNKSENLYFIRSQDLGETWDLPVQVTFFEDDEDAWTREANLVVDKNTDNIYMQFQSDGPSHMQTNKYKSDVYIVYSADFGENWSNYTKVNNDQIGVSDQFAGSIAIDDSVNPSRLYIAYENRANTSNLDVYVATTTINNITSWGTAIKIDDSAIGSIHPSIYVNPVDKAVCVAWVDTKNLGGLGRVLFDRSTNSGTSWIQDKIVETIEVNDGPFETCMAVDPSSGKPAIMWREMDILGNKCTHKFALAENAEGTLWKDPVNLSQGESPFCWAGTLDVSSDGHWVAVFEQDYQQASDWRGMFTQSSDGASWSAPVEFDDAKWVFGISMVLDECNTAHVIWCDSRTDQTKTELYYDVGS